MRLTIYSSLALSFMPAMNRCTCEREKQAPCNLRGFFLRAPSDGRVGGDHDTVVSIISPIPQPLVTRASHPRIFGTQHEILRNFINLTGRCQLY